jgi:hypothetical protein
MTSSDLPTGLDLIAERTAVLNALRSAAQGQTAPAAETARELWAAYADAAADVDKVAAHHRASEHGGWRAQLAAGSIKHARQLARQALRAAELPELAERLDQVAALEAGPV